MEKNTLSGHFAALFTTTVWGITYVSTKYLVGSFAPTEILIIRLAVAISLLSIVCRRKITFSFKTEKYFMLAGLTGICLYFTLENYALTVTSASNVGIIVASAPLFTGILSWIVYGDRQALSWQFITGFFLSFTGIAMLSLRGSDISVHPAGDMLVILACISWAVYSITIKKISSYGYNSIAVTRRVFLWGLLFILPLIPFSNINYSDLSRYADPVSISNLLFLGAVASAACFASWNYAVKIIGAVKTCIYIYAGPAITVLFAFLFLGEQLNLKGFTGCGLTTLGLVISSLNRQQRKGRENEKTHPEIN